MAKKKSRSLNIARKRTKRNLNKKSRRKQLAIKKQQTLQNEKSDEERLQEKILQSRRLLDEPEFESITFNPDLLRQKMLELLESSLNSLANEQNTDVHSESISEIENLEHETIGDKFRQEVLPNLITADLIRSISYALRACETRLKLTGQRDKAEVAFVAKSLFELADPETLAFHPLVLKITARTLEQLLEQPQFMLAERSAVENVLSDVLSFNTAQGGAESPDDETQKEGIIDSEETLVAVSQVNEALYVVSPESLPAKALYKNFNGLETRKTLEAWDGYRVIRETDQQVEFAHPEHQHYITLTADRLLLQCVSKTQLNVAMNEMEKQCGQALFYLARTVDGT